MSRGIPVVWLIFLHCILCLVDCKLLDNVCYKDDLDCLHPNIDATGKLEHGKCLRGNTLRRHLDISLLECVRECMVTSQCTGINYRKNWKLCDVTSNVSGNYKLVDEKDCMYSDIGSWSKKLAGICSHHNCPEGTSCKVGTTGPFECTQTYCKGLPETPPHAHSIEKFGLYRSVGQGNKFSCDDNFTLRGPPFVVCTKKGEWTTLFCCVEDSLPTDCGDLPNTSPSGVYKIYPSGGCGFDVYCDMEEDGGGWTVFQRRFNGTTRFNRNWNAYSNGFGNVAQEFWLGNKILHQLTSSKNYVLRVDLEDINGTKAFAVYLSFRISDEASSYALHVGTYNGTAGDSLSRHQDMKFSTVDEDNDHRRNLNCANVYESGWWFNGDRWCYQDHSNLNARYHGVDTQAMRWKSWPRGYSLKTTKMMIRQK